MRRAERGDSTTRANRRVGSPVPERVSDFNNPFTKLNSVNLPPGSSKDTNRNEPPRKSRGRVDIIRVKAKRRGKTVTVVQSFVGIGLPEKEKLLKEMQKTCGVGGT